jgi:Tol biopolymer transport system component
VRTRLLLALAACAAAAPLAAAGGSSPGGGTIVYWSDVPFPSIWAVRADGSDARRILDNRRNAKRPRLSPDGTWVAFDGTPAPKPLMSDFDVQLVRLDGTGLRTLTTTRAWDTDAQWSPDGRLLSFDRRPPHGGDGSSVRILRLDGRADYRLAAGSSARWSPDGRSLVFSAPTARSAGDLFTIHPDGSGRTLLLASPNLKQPADWSPDGTRILFTRYDPSGRPSVVVADADGTRVRRLAAGIAACFSPDGSQILFTGASSSPLYAMRADGSKRRVVVRGPAYEPDWR